jgi:hypothetical protein
MLLSPIIAEFPWRGLPTTNHTGRKRNDGRPSHEKTPCDVIVQRWEEFTGKKAERVEAAVDVPDPEGGDTATTLAHVATEADG